MRINEPTHFHGGTLDHLYTRSDDSVLNLSVDPPGILSDHSFINWRQPDMHSCTAAIRKTVRSWKRVDRDLFRRALLESRLCGDIPDSLDSETLFDMYDNELRLLSDFFAPEKTIKITERQKIAVWYDEESRQSFNLIVWLGFSRRKKGIE